MKNEYTCNFSVCAFFYLINNALPTKACAKTA